MYKFVTFEPLISGIPLVNKNKVKTMDLLYIYIDNKLGNIKQFTIQSFARNLIFPVYFHLDFLSKFQQKY